MKTIAGAYVIDAPFSALNNSGIDKRSGNENAVATKTIQSPAGIRPYISAQALRYWWRAVLEHKFEWKCSPVEMIGKNQAVTKADPLQYDDDDVFGYMSAKKEETTDGNGRKKMKDATVTRVSPLKCSPLIGFPIRPNKDFGAFVRKREGDPIIFTHEFYSNIFKGIFALDIDAVGKFTVIDKAGSKNLSADLAKKYEEQGMKKDEVTYRTQLELKKKRITETIKALKYLNGGAMQALHHTDVTPKLIILAVLKSGNNIFMDVMPHNKYEDGILNIDALSEVLDDYKSDIASKVYIGKLSGFGTDSDQEMGQFKAPTGVTVVVTTPVKAIDQFTEELNQSPGIISE